MNLQTIKHNFNLGKMDLKEIKWLIDRVEELENEPLPVIDNLIKRTEEQQAEIESYKLQETLLLGRLEKVTLEYKQLKQDRRLIAYYEMAEENLKMAQELALLKGELSG